MDIMGKMVPGKKMVSSSSPADSAGEDRQEKPTDENKAVLAVRGQVRLKDIAELAGVHVTAVSAVLSPRGNTRTRVSEATAARIRELAARLNYQPHLAARMMKRRRSGTIGLMEYFHSEVSVRRTNALATMLRERGYHVLRLNASWYESVEDALDYFVSSQVEGVIFVMVGGEGLPRKVQGLQNAGIACVTFDGIRFSGMPQVRTDTKLGMVKLVEHLLSLGKRRLVLMLRWGSDRHDDAYSWPTLSRRAGFEQAILEAGGELFEDITRFKEYDGTGIVGLSLIDPQGVDSALGYSMTNRVLDADCNPHALLCSNDGFALGALRACYERNVQVPRDMAVVGMNGERGTEFYSPPLTTVDILNIPDMEVVVNLLIRLIQGELPPDYSEIVPLPCKLIVRQSCGAQLQKPIDG